MIEKCEKQFSDTKFQVLRLKWFETVIQIEWKIDDKMVDYYEILEVQKTANSDEIKKA